MEIKEILKSVVSKTVVGSCVLLILALVFGIPLYVIWLWIWNYKEVYAEILKILPQLKPLLPHMWIIAITLLGTLWFIFWFTRLLAWSFDREMWGEEEIGDWPKTFGEYVTMLNDFLSKNPSLADKKVVYGVDSEWNAFHEVYWSPSFGVFESDEKYFESKEAISEEVNAVCIN